MSLTGNKETDFLILMELNDNELTKVCQANKYINKLCNDDSFWRNRIIINFKYDPQIANSMMKYLEFDSWKEYYIWLKQLNKYSRNLIIKSLEPSNIEIVNEAVKKMKTLSLLKWINREEFYKIFRRHCFINVQPELHQEYLYDEDEENKIDEVAWKSAGAIKDEEFVTKIFVDQWFNRKN